MMQVIEVRAAGKAHPFGDHRIVNQPFPSSLAPEITDPFLMCDDYSFVSEGLAQSPDDFPVDWHPHRGMDVVSYIKKGRGRHADSLGNRGEFETPGMQWMSCGSGVEHAEGGATPEGEVREGFQIWVNVPSARKMDDPRYGTVPPEKLAPVELTAGARARLLAGHAEDGRVGPMSTVQPVLMVDLELAPGTEVSQAVPQDFETCLVYVYKGAGSVCGHAISRQNIARLDAVSESSRQVRIAANAGEELHVLFLSGKRIDEPIAWHGPIVMNTDHEIQQTLRELRSGSFPPKRAAWDYRRASAAPRPRK